MMPDLNRRQFLLWSAAGVATTWAGPSLAGPEGPPLRLGVQGLGAAGRRSLDSLVSAAGIEVRALCDLRADRLASAVRFVSSRAPQPLSLRDPRRLLDADLDGLVVTVPEAARLGAVDAACRAGRHVLVEPLPWTPARALEAIVDLAEDRGLAVAQRRRWQVAGDARSVRALLDPKGAASAARPPMEARSGTGVVVNLGIGSTASDRSPLTAADEGLDVVDFARTVLGPGRVERVTAIHGKGRDCSDRIDARFLFDDGRWLHFAALAGAASPVATVEVHTGHERHRFDARPAGEKAGDDDLRTWTGSIGGRRTAATHSVPMVAVRQSRELLEQIESALDR